MCVKRTLILACLGDSRIDSELTLGLFYSISEIIEIIFTFLLTRDCRLLIVDFWFEFNDCFTYNTKFYFDPWCSK